MKLSMRSYQSEDDYQRIRDFLRQVFLLNGRRQLSWTVVRMDYWRWHGINNLGHGTLEKNVYLWETLQGQLAAVLNSEGPGHAHFHVHPDFRAKDLEEKMILQAEECLRVPSRRGGYGLWIWTNAGDGQRIELLTQHGFVHIAEADEHQWRRSLDLPIPRISLAEGYIIRPLGDEVELPSRSWASWRAFHSNEPDEKYESDWRWYLNIQAAPLYRRDLDLVAIAPSGEVAAFTTIWYDEATFYGEFEPVGTVPEHQRRGLARGLMYEGMRRLQRSGATQCMVTGGSVHANGLYQAVMSSSYDLYQPWEKRWSE
jgi:mycothiol synthase